jgi:hypothetical protein
MQIDYSGLVTVLTYCTIVNSKPKNVTRWSNFRGQVTNLYRCKALIEFYPNTLKHFEQCT